MLLAVGVLATTAVALPPDGPPDQPPFAGAPAPLLDDLTPAEDCPAPRPGTLTVQTIPWTVVSVDDGLVGTTPMFRLELAAGPHRLRFKNEARGVDVVEDIVIEEGRAHKLKLLLVADDKETLLVEQQPGAELDCIDDDDAGFVSIQTTPWSKVWINGRLVGVTPLFQQKVRAGQHALRFRGKDGQIVATRVQVAAGEVVKVAIALPAP